MGSSKGIDQARLQVEPVERVQHVDVGAVRRAHGANPAAAA
jgi:hypothetical protein